MAMTALSQAPPPENGKIAFASDRDGNLEIYTINHDGSGIGRLTFNAGRDDYPAWSPDGSKIAYLSANSPGGQMMLMIMNANGSAQRIVTAIDFNLVTSNFCGERFAMDWSPDGNRIVFQEFGNIVTVNIDGTNRQNVTTSPLRESEPSWGLTNQFAYSSSNALNDNPLAGLWIFLTSTNVWFGDYGYYTCSVSPDLTRDGTKLAYVAQNDFTPPGDIWIANPNTPDGQQTLDFDRVMNVRWSPDGHALVFGSITFTSPCCIYQIEVVDEFGQGRRVLTQGTNPSWGAVSASRTTPADFDGDRRSDISVFRPSDRLWYLNRSTAGMSATQFGLSTDKITPADYDGDGKTDISVYRDGTWYWLKSSDASFSAAQFGLPADIPVPADYTGDGRAELAIYRDGIWWSLDLVNGQTAAFQFGVATDKPVVADYDGDFKADQAVYRGNGEWHINRSTQGYTAVQFGLATDMPVVGDYDGDSKADPAVYRDGTWYLLRSQAGFAGFQFGLATDTPTPADYDGDGKTDAAVYRNGTWYLLHSTSGFAAQQFGLVNDKPVPAAYLP